MSNKESFRSFASLTAIIGAVLICIGIADGHGGEKHDSTKTPEKATSDTLSSSQNTTMDSVYATIQSEFTALAPVFKKGCFDCHTTRTEFPWYYNVPIVKGMIDDDIAEARKHMDLSEGFPFGGHGKPVDDLVAVRAVVVDGGMPPLSYRMMHWSAKPSESERDSIVAWLERGLASLAAIGVVPTESDSTNVDSTSHQ
jgi:hypothetical protein